MMRLPIILFLEETGSVFGTGRNENISSALNIFVVVEVSNTSP